MPFTYTDILKLFIVNLNSFLDGIIEQFPNEGDIHIFKLFINNNIPAKDVVEKFMLYIDEDNKKLRVLISKEDERYFIDENPLSFLNKNKKDKFGRLWVSGVLDDEDKQIIWKWIHLFVKLGDKYKVALNEITI